MADYLASFRPLASTAAGRRAAKAFGLPPFIDGSCRREPDFQSPAPSITALCRAGKFAPRLSPGDRVAYIAGRLPFGNEEGWALVALLRVHERFESHGAAAVRYHGRGYPLPSNCLVHGNPPEPFERTNGKPPLEVRERLDLLDSERAIRLWDASYQRRAREHGVFLATFAEFLELITPPVLGRADLLAVFGLLPGTQNPGRIALAEYEALSSLARTTGRVRTSLPRAGE